MIEFHEMPRFSMFMIAVLRFLSSGRPRYLPSVLAFTTPCNWRRRSIVIAQSIGPASAVVSAFICLHRKTVGVASAEWRPSISRAMIRFHSSGNLQSEGRTRVG